MVGAQSGNMREHCLIGRKREGWSLYYSNERRCIDSYVSKIVASIETQDDTK